jgi:hypothetical protein
MSANDPKRTFAHVRLLRALSKADVVRAPKTVALAIAFVPGSFSTSPPGFQMYWKSDFNVYPLPSAST